MNLKEHISYYPTHYAIGFFVLFVITSNSVIYFLHDGFNDISISVFFLLHLVHLLILLVAFLIIGSIQEYIEENIDIDIYSYSRDYIKTETQQYLPTLTYVKIIDNIEADLDDSDSLRKLLNFLKDMRSECENDETLSFLIDEALLLTGAKLDTYNQEVNDDSTWLYPPMLALGKKFGAAKGDLESQVEALLDYSTKKRNEQELLEYHIKNFTSNVSHKQRVISEKKLYIILVSMQLLHIFIAAFIHKAGIFILLYPFFG